MCRQCGREACHECFEQVKELTTDRPGATEAEQIALQARREKHAHINPFFLSCTRRNEHRAADFSPMTRFSKDELLQTIKDMEVLLDRTQLQTTPCIDGGLSGESASGNSVPPLEQGSVGHQPQITESPTARASGSSIPSPGSSTKPTSSHKDSAIPPQSSSFATSDLVPLSQPLLTSPVTPTLTPRYFTDAELTDDVFRETWKLGEPMVVTDLLKKFTLQWTPEYFKTKYGSQNCLILECQNDVNKRMTVGEFFDLFGKYEGRRDCWKLKVSST
jgi:[histone H3]-dimethyl-L-lysine9 demethylase